MKKMQFWSRHQRYFLWSGLVLVGLTFGLIGFEYSDELETAAVSRAEEPANPPAGKISLVIKERERLLEVYQDGQFYKQYRVAVGKGETPTPIGEWNVVWKDYNWGTGFGTRWMGLNVPWGIYGIHGTNKPWSIGQFASHGCIRLRNKDVEELFEWVPIGTPVRIDGRRTKVERVLKFQIAGPDVVILQMKLKELGFLAGRADGIFGKDTEQAVKNLQLEKGLPQDGIVNKQLIELMEL
ncbi:L,D-transpeptidase family protein [Acetonema longum]|uniref:Erfk/ybis/ycfs/ynhg n=1 Tax=Acetonema longum DSM 6540 TaxID=1009370 RepID=F7NNH7_9FIRM|nr:L,D-transpeptidase family protein [Acetonema longum]EGO62418.1 erfk/ybis/ycfs/ynhg [Acetonema longum DSM 6540]